MLQESLWLSRGRPPSQLQAPRIASWTRSPPATAARRPWPQRGPDSSIALSLKGHWGEGVGRYCSGRRRFQRESLWGGRQQGPMQGWYSRSKVWGTGCPRSKWNSHSTGHPHTTPPSLNLTVLAQFSCTTALSLFRQDSVLSLNYLSSWHSHNSYEVWDEVRDDVRVVGVQNETLIPQGTPTQTLHHWTLPCQPKCTCTTSLRLFHQDSVLSQFPILMNMRFK